ncbi:glycosyltransferase [Frondihabitans sucicola]|nr:glycosyltransferase [Frondihabitans sucicola]
MSIPTPKPTLLVATSTLPARAGDGTPGFVLDLAKAVSGDFDVVIVAPMVGRAARHEVIDGVTIHRYSYFPRRFQDLADGAIVENLRAKRSRWVQVPFFFAAMAFALRRANKRYAPALAHLHWIIPQGIVGSAVLGDLPRVVTTLGGDLYALQGGAPTRLKRRVIRGARFVTCMSADMAVELEKLGARSDQVRVIPMGVDVGPVERAVESTPRESGRLLFVGRLVEKKGAAVLLDALALLPADESRSVIVVGDGPLRGRLEAQAGPEVEFVGQRGRDDLAREYAMASVALYPSVPASNGDRDGLPVALLEAMTAGCVVIASRAPGIVDVIVDGVNGLLVEPGDATALANAVSRVEGDAALRERLGSAARETARDYSVEAVSAKYRDILGRTLHG